MTVSFEAEAPGKLILSGEHAVVHGCPALVTAVDRMAVCRVTADREDRLTISAPQFCETVQAEWEELAENYQQLRADYVRFLRGDIPISRVVCESGRLLLFAVAEALENVEPQGMRIQLETDIPVCCGMGSSAAVTASVIAAVRKRDHLPLTRDILFAKTMECEKLQHGNPSGVDAYASVYGGTLLYRKGQPIIKTDAGLPAYELIHTGVPEASTGECVSAVRAAFENENRKKQFEEITLAIQQALKNGDKPLLAEEIRKNHQLLQETGVVPSRVTQFIAEVEKRGGAAKVCGAGSVRGDAAGIVWVIPPDDKQALETLREEYGYTPLSCCMHKDGIRV